jgi:hypothetical protein
LGVKSSGRHPASAVANSQQPRHSQARGTLRRCRPGCRSGRVDGGIDSATRTSARQPSATAPSRCRFWCGASPAAAECDVCASRSGWMPHHSRGRRAHRRAGTGVDRVRLAGWNRIDQGQGFLRVISISASQTDCEWDALRIRDQMPFAPALGAIGGIRTCLRAATHGPHRATVNDRTRPINFAVARQPVQKREVDQIPLARPLPIAQTAPARHPPRRTRVPVGASARGYRCEGRRQCRSNTRSETRGRPPFCRRGGIGKKGWTSSQKASGGSLAKSRSRCLAACCCYQAHHGRLIHVLPGSRRRVPYRTSTSHLRTVVAAPPRRPPA